MRLDLWMKRVKSVLWARIDGILSKLQEMLLSQVF